MSNGFLNYAAVSTLGTYVTIQALMYVCNQRYARLHVRLQHVCVWDLNM